MKDVGRNLQQIISTLRTKSAVNPALIFAAICMLGGLAGAIFAPPPLNYVFTAIAAFGVLIAAGQILFFTAFDRDRLHDEEHVENKMLIEAFAPILADADNIIEVDATRVLTSNTNPDEVK